MFKHLSYRSLSFLVLHLDLGEIWVRSGDISKSHLVVNSRCKTPAILCSHWTCQCGMRLILAHTNLKLSPLVGSHREKMPNTTVVYFTKMLWKQCSVTTELTKSILGLGSGNSYYLIHLYCCSFGQKMGRGPLSIFCPNKQQYIILLKSTAHGLFTLYCSEATNRFLQVYS